MWCVKRLSAGFAAILMSIDVSGQRVTLIPDRSASINSYSLGEWIAQASGLGWVSYDRIQGTIPANAVFVRGMPLATTWNGNAWFGMPNWPISDLDSVVIHEPGSVVGGFAAPDGAIDLYPRSERGITAEVGAVTATRDPGTLIGTPYTSPNVERISQYARLGWIRENGFTRINLTSHSYSVGLGLDGKPYGGLYDRTYDPSQPDLFPYQTRVSVSHGQYWSNHLRRCDLIAVAHVDPQQYIYDAGLGRETAIRTVFGHLALRNEPISGEGWRWLVSGGGIRYHSLRFEPTEAEPLESTFRGSVGYTSKLWNASLLASEHGNGLGFGLTGHQWRADAILDKHQQLVSLNLDRRWVRFGASIVYKDFYRYHRYRVDFPIGLGFTHFRYLNKPNRQTLRVDWRGGFGYGTHRFDAVAGWLAIGDGDPQYSKVQTMGVWRWQAHPTFGIAVSAGHRSARHFNGPFPYVPAHTDISMNLYQTFFRGRLRTELGLRNILDQMDTDHPDGLIYPMSVEVRMRLALNKTP